MTAPPDARREVEEPLELAADRARRSLRASRGRAGCARLERPDGSPIIPVPPPTSATGRPPCRWSRSSPKIGTRCPTWSDRPGRIEADVAGDRAAGREAGRQAGRRRVQDPAPFELGQEPAEGRSARGGVTAGRVEPSRNAGGRGERSFTTPMLSCGQMHTSLARRQRHRRASAPAPGGVADRPSLAVLHRHPDPPPRPSCCAAWPALLGRGRRLQLLRRGPARPQGRPHRPRVRPADARLRPDRQDRARRLGALKREVVDLRPDPGRDARRDDRDRGQGLLGQPGLRPGRHRLGRRSTRSTAGRAAPRRSPSSSSARDSCPPSAFEGCHVGAQDPRDHPVAPPDPGVSRARPASSRSSPPT